MASEIVPSTSAEKKPGLPPEHKKRLWQGVGAFALLAVAVAGWVALKSPQTLDRIEARTPQAEAAVHTVYLTPEAAAGNGATTPETTAGLSPRRDASIALIMTGLGLSEKATKRALNDLPDEVGLAFSAYGDLPRLIKSARSANHEPFVLLPMEPSAYPKDDPGPRALLTRVSEAENARNLSALMKDSKGAAGMMNFMGSAFMSDQRSLSLVFAELRKARLSFIEHPESSESTLASSVAKDAGLSYAVTDMDIDASATETDIGQKLIALEKLARERGRVIGVIEPYPVSFTMVESWAETLASRGIRLVPVSTILAEATPSPAPAPAPQNAPVPSPVQ